MAIEHIKLSQQAKDQLIKLKRKTGIQNWNVLCRWAFCLSLAEPSIPAPAKIPADSSVEMTWKIFAGKYQELYFAMLKERCRIDGFPMDVHILSEQFKLHIHRGIGYLSSRVTSKQIEHVADLVGMVPSGRID
jgi:DNA sulfur modification protein DndE